MPMISLPPILCEYNTDLKLRDGTLYEKIEILTTCNSEIRVNV